jgi:fibronectin-binding autotransporter adhesin
MGSATVGSMIAFTNNGGAVNGAAGGLMFFFDNSNAGNGAFTSNGGAVSGGGSGGTVFHDDATAGSGTFTTNGGAVSGAFGGQTNFFDSAKAASATLIANGGVSGATGGLIRFSGDSTGGTARVEVFGNGNLDISSHNAPGVTIGSVEGTGDVFLGARNLTVGSNNLSTSFSGVIQDGGLTNGTGGSLTKIGTGTLTLSGANTYTGGTTISGGTLVVNNSTGSGTGSGVVGVNSGGTLVGIGFIDGPVTINNGGAISPGQSPGTLTINSALTLNSNATYQFELNSSTAAADKIVANGVTINGATFSFTDLGNGTLAPGTVFTITDNTSGLPITGLFVNLANNATFTNNGNTYQAFYGNDLTLTVVPEPTTYALFILGATLLLFAPKRRTHT